MKLCPFCQRKITDHHPQCHYGFIPSAEEIIKRENRKKELDSAKISNMKRIKK